MAGRDDRFPAITMTEGAMESIARDIAGVFVRVPGRGAETGGILVGRRDRSGVAIYSFVPVVSEHRYGRLYKLSAADRKNLRNALDASRQPGDGTVAVGLYRSNARADFFPDDDDRELQSANFPEAERLLLLVQPGLPGPTLASFFFWGDGRLEQAMPPEVFPFPPTEPAKSESVARPHAPAKWKGPVAAAALVAVAAAGAGVLALSQRRAPVAPPQVKTAELPAPQVAPPPAPTPPPPATPPPEPPNNADSIRAFLDRWASAIRRGAVEEAASMYTAGQARENARDMIAGLLGNEDRMDVFRLDHIEIAETKLGQAVATFRAHWQSGGYPKVSGERQMRMSLIKSGDKWRIISETQ